MQIDYTKMNALGHVFVFFCLYPSEHLFVLCCLFCFVCFWMNESAHSKASVYKLCSLCTSDTWTVPTTKKNQLSWQPHSPFPCALFPKRCSSFALPFQSVRSTTHISSLKDRNFIYFCTMKRGEEK